jgi:hypothetical protein
MKKIVKKESTKGRNKLDDKKLPNPKPTPSRTKSTSKLKPKMTLSEFKNKTKAPKPKDLYATKEGKLTLKGKGRTLVATKKQQAASQQVKKIQRQFGL